MAALLVIWLLGGVAIGGGIGYAIGQGRGRGVAGFWLGSTLGIVGWVIVAVLEPSDAVRRARQQETLAAVLHGRSADGQRSDGEPTRSCPLCAETIKAAASLCRYCGSTIEPILELETDQQAADEPSRGQPAATLNAGLENTRGLASTQCRECGSAFFGLGGACPECGGILIPAVPPSPIQDAPVSLDVVDAQPQVAEPSDDWAVLVDLFVDDDGELLHELDEAGIGHWTFQKSRRGEPTLYVTHVDMTRASQILDRFYGL